MMAIDAANGGEGNGNGNEESPPLSSRPSLKKANAAELAEYARQLDQLLPAETDKASLLLNELYKVSISVSLLADSGIGKAVNTLRKKSADDAIQKKAKALVQHWKSICDNEVASDLNANGSGSGPALPTTPSSPSLTPSASFSGSDSPFASGKKPSLESAATSSISSLKRSSSTSSSTGSSSGGGGGALGISTGDAHRDACIRALAKALDNSASDDSQLSDFIVLLARQIEECIFKEFGSEVSVKYKAAVRSKSFNLKKNEDFRRRVCVGEYPPEKVARMTSEEMATKELNEERKKLTTEALNDAQMPTPKTSKTDQLRCGKCGKRDASYFQLQTRSSDEPMTTFVTCNVCGHNWKFC